METNLNTIKEMILDEQKLITYISLSKELCIHVNEAKSLLNKAVEDIKENQPDIHLNVCYILSGLNKDNSARTVVCSASELEDYKNNFKTVFFHHIYSVSLHSRDVDSAALVSLTKLEDFPLCTGLIKSNTCCKRTLDEIGKLKSNSQLLIAEQKVAPVVKKEKSNLTNGGVNRITKDNETKSAPEIKTEVISPKKESSSVSNKSNTKNGKSKSIAGFFSKSNSVPSAKSKESKTQEINKTNNIDIKKESSLEEMDVDTEPEPVKEPVKEKEVVVKKELKSGTKNSKKDSKLEQIRKNAKVDKKRKRVLNVLDSDSDDDPFADETPTVKENSDDEIPPTPATNTVKITSGILNPKKKRKIVDKTYTDEEGYILTRKEEVYESCSDEDVMKPEPQVKIEKENVEQVNKVQEVSPKDKKAKTTKKKISPPQKGKQQTMMNFFKKV